MMRHRSLARPAEIVFLVLVLLSPGVLGSDGALAGPQFAVAVNGYDVVAYQRSGEAVAGRNEHAHFWNGVTWLFVSDENRAAFAADPGRYAPRYDGYCAYAAAKGYKAPGSPLYWRLVNGRLYLNFSNEAQRLWAEDIPGHIAAADANWPRINAN